MTAPAHERRAVTARTRAACPAVFVPFLGRVHWGLAFVRLQPPAAMIVVCLVVDHRVYPRLQIARWLPSRRLRSAVSALSCAAGAVMA